MQNQTSTPRVYGAPKVNGCGCARSNGGDGSPIFAILGIAGIAMVGWFLTKPERDAKIEKDRAIAQAIREGKVANLNVGQTDAKVVSYGAMF